MRARAAYYCLSGAAAANPTRTKQRKSETTHHQWSGTCASDPEHGPPFGPSPITSQQRCAWACALPSPLTLNRPLDSPPFPFWVPPCSSLVPSCVVGLGLAHNVRYFRMPFQISATLGAGREMDLGAPLPPGHKQSAPHVRGRAREPQSLCSRPVEARGVEKAPNSHQYFKRLRGERLPLGGSIEHKRIKGGVAPVVRKAPLERRLVQSLRQEREGRVGHARGFGHRSTRRYHDFALC